MSPEKKTHGSLLISIFKGIFKVVSDLVEIFIKSMSHEGYLRLSEIKREWERGKEFSVLLIKDHKYAVHNTIHTERERESGNISSKITFLSKRVEGGNFPPLNFFFLSRSSILFLNCFALHVTYHPLICHHYFARFCLVTLQTKRERERKKCKNSFSPSSFFSLRCCNNIIIFFLVMYRFYYCLLYIFYGSNNNIVKLHQ